MEATIEEKDLESLTWKFVADTSSSPVRYVENIHVFPFFRYQCVGYGERVQSPHPWGFEPLRIGFNLEFSP